MSKLSTDRAVAWALTSRLRTAMPFNWPNKVSSSVCTLAHIPDIIIAAIRGKVRWRSRVKAPASGAA